MKEINVTEQVNALLSKEHSVHLKKIWKYTFLIEGISGNDEIWADAKKFYPDPLFEIWLKKRLWWNLVWMQESAENYQSNPKID